MSMEFRVYGYTRSSDIPGSESRQAQQEAIEAYARRSGLPFHGCYGDTVASGSLPLYRREAGAKLVDDLRAGDHVIATRPDRLADSFLEMAFTLDSWSRLGVCVHILEVGARTGSPVCRLDPADPGSRQVIETVTHFARAWPAMVGARVKASHARLKGEGRRCSRFAPFGFKWQRRGNKTFAVPDEREQAIIARVLELKDEGYSFDQIRQYVNYTWGMRNRKGHEFGHSEIKNMVYNGARARFEAQANADASESSADK